MDLKDILRPMDGRCLCTEQGMHDCYRFGLDVLQRGVPGLFVECGVAWGGMAGCFAKAMVTMGEFRTFHLFDSFCGIPVAGPRDDCQPGVGGPKPEDDQAPMRDRLRPSGVGPAVARREVENNLRDWFGETVDWKFHEGWFQDTVAGSDTGPIALLHLDGDLYESTLVCLEGLYNRVSPGGVVVVDDYELTGCRAAVVDYFGVLPAGMKPFADYGAMCWEKP